MSANDTKWIVGGTFLIAGLSALLAIAQPMTIFVPAPLHLVMLIWAISYLYLLPLPIIYVTGYFALRNRSWFRFVTMALLVSLSGLSLWYFAESWSYGTIYQSRGHTRIVALENLAMISFICFCLFKSSTDSVFWPKLSYLMLMCWVSWCAFPYLGETP